MSKNCKCSGNCGKLCKCKTEAKGKKLGKQ